MKNTIKKINKVIQTILLAPIKLPGKALNIIRYVALGLGIVEQVLEEEKEENEDMEGGSHGEPS